MEKTFKKYLESKGFSESSRKRIYKETILFINWSEKERIESEYATYRELLSYVQYLKSREVKQITIQLYISGLKHYFSWCIARNLITENPVRKIDIKGIKRRSLYYILNNKELELLYYNFSLEEETPKYNYQKVSQLSVKRNKVILGLMIYQGLGTQELGNLDLKDVKLREGKIYISGSRKSNERTLKLESHQVLDIMEYTLQTRNEILELNNKKSDKLIVSTGKSDEVGNVMSKLMKKLKTQNEKVESVRQIRTSIITKWLKMYNLREVQYMAGHKFVSSTEAYFVNDLEDLQEDIGKYHPF